MRIHIKQTGLVLLATTVFLTGAFSQKSDPATSKPADQSKKKELPVVTIEMQNGGIIKYEMYPSKAPKTVERISQLIKEGFYNGLTFHRVVPGFVVQGGDPKGNGTGGTGVKLPLETSELEHKPGTVAMARAADPNSADCQFYICLGSPSHLDGNYTIFGQVTEGMDIVEKIKTGDVMKKVTIAVPGEKKTTPE